MANCNCIPSPAPPQSGEGERQLPTPPRPFGPPLPAGQGGKPPNCNYTPPQAFSHFSLISAAYNLDKAIDGKKDPES